MTNQKVTKNQIINDITSFNLTQKNVKNYLNQIKNNFNEKEYYNYATTDNIYVDMYIDDDDIFNKNNIYVLKQILINLILQHFVQKYNLNPTLDLDLVDFITDKLLEKI